MKELPSFIFPGTRRPTRQLFCNFKTHLSRLLHVHVATASLLFFLIFVVLAFGFSLWFKTPRYFVDNPRNETILRFEIQQEKPKKIEIPLSCTNPLNQNQTLIFTCPKNYPETFKTLQDLNYDDEQTNRTCPDYFKWIHEDLSPWKTTGITREMLEGAKTTAHFRLVIQNGTAFVEKYKKSIQTRDKFTLWGILQLLRRYPGRLPDLELMFDCDDRPVIRSDGYRQPNGTVGLPPLFRYCGDRRTMDIVFPDWSFWGWAEINIKPWEIILKEIEEGNRKRKWIEREPFAYWKGNPYVAETRQDLLKCNVSDQYDWNARLFIQDWILEGQRGFKDSNIASQCTYRYKIYIEGYGWSVSEKYILGCDSVTLMVKPRFYDFFSRSLQPLQHYWPIRDTDKCKSIKFAVDWGNNHKQKANGIGKATSKFIQEDLKMENVYDYMFHLLNEYAKLLRFKPQAPRDAVELCSEAMVCPSKDGPEKRFMMDSFINGPSISSPCNLPPPFEPKVLQGFVRRKLNIIRQVEKWEYGYWKGVNN